MYLVEAVSYKVIVVVVVVVVGAAVVSCNCDIHMTMAAEGKNVMV